MASVWPSVSCNHETGMVPGLATVTPASGFIGVPGGLMGLAGGVACYIAVDILRVRMKIDDWMSLPCMVLAVFGQPVM